MPADSPHPRNITDIALGNSDDLADLYSRSLTILSLQASIRRELGPPLAEHIYVANTNPDSITLYTDNQTWATRLRFQTASIIELARKLTGYKDLEVLRIRVSPSLFKSPAPEPAPLLLSAATSRLLSDTAGSTTNPALRAALEKLSRHKR
jgi:hypothetical protein